MPGIETSPFAISPTALAKMEERKRPATYDNDETAPPAKRHITANVNGDARSHQDADIPGKDDLEKFQKEAIYRQMQEYKREKTTLENQLGDITAKAAHHDEHVRQVDAWLWQVLDEVKLAIDKMDGGVTFHPFPSTLLTSNSKTFEEFLKSRSESLTTTIEQILSTKGVVDPTFSEMQERIAKLVHMEKSHAIEIERLLSEKSQLEERLESASMRYMMAEKKLDRAKSATVAKLERQATAMGRNEPTSGSGGTTGNKSEKGESQVDTEVLAGVEKAKNAALAASAIQAQQLTRLEEDNANLRSQLTVLNIKNSSSANEEFLSQTELFKQLSTRHDDAVKKANNLEALNTEIREEIARLQGERTAYHTQIEGESRTAISEKDQQLDKAERDLARVRTARDELIADVQMRKTAQEQEKASIEQIKQQIAAKEDRIKALESELERISSDGQKCINGTLEELSLDELRAKHANLERQYAMLNTELASMSEAYKKMSSANTAKVANLTELEEKVARLSAEKSKADQKYFAAMKSKDAREQEVRALRAQNTRSADIISSLKDVSQARDAQIANYDKLLSESNLARSSVEAKLADTQQQLELRRLQIEAIKKETEELSSIATNKDLELTAVTSAQRKLEVSIEELKVDVADKDKKIESWKAKGMGGESEHHEALRSLVICGVCRRNFKDTVIRTCGHVFCKECVEDRLANRMRKCPNCNRGFGGNDCMHITM